MPLRLGARHWFARELVGVGRMGSGIREVMHRRSVDEVEASILMTIRARQGINTRMVNRHDGKRNSTKGSRGIKSTTTDWVFDQIRHSEERGSRRGMEFVG